MTKELILSKGQILKDRYVIEKKVGYGGMSQVFSAFDLHNKRNIAIKHLLSKSKESKTRFKREYKFLRIINHPSLVKAYQYFQQDNNSFMVLELVEGTSLGEILSSGERILSLPEQISIAIQITKVIEAINSEEILHRDIKPDNIMLDLQTGKIKLLDLGISKDLSGDFKKLTMNDQLLGTLPYLSPEQTEEGSSNNSDVFSLGVMLYQFFLWDKKSPFCDQNIFAILYRISNHDPIPISKRIQEIHQKNNTPLSSQHQIYENLSSIIAKAMEKNPLRRWNTAGEMAEELILVQKLGDEQFQHKQDKKTDKPTQSTRRKRTLSRHKQSQKRISSSNRRKNSVLFAFVFLTILSASYFWLNKTNPKKTVNRIEMTSSPLKKKMPGGFSKDLWKKCWDGKRFDFTISAWEELYHEEQIKYANLYQNWYALSEKNGKTEKSFVLEETNFTMILIPPGIFWMGASKDEAKSKFEEPRHKVVIERPFWIGKYEVTQEQWQNVMGDNPSHFKQKEKNLPMEMVSWSMGKSFCKKTGMRFPSEAQWEYACRAGTTTTYYWGMPWDKSKINSFSYWAQRDIFDHRQRRILGLKEHYPEYGSKPVGSFPPNAFGLFDMLGNVWECCEDVWHPNYEKAPKDGSSWVDSQSSHRVMRGGSWNDGLRACRSAYRTPSEPEFKVNIMGFRVVLKE